MSMLDLLSSPDTWEAFYRYKTSLICPEAEAEALRAFIDARVYLPVCEGMAAGHRFALPRRAVISKMGTQKKRVVYIYPPAENMVCKLLTWLLLRRYDELFADGLYSFRPGRTAKDAVRRFLRTPGIRQQYTYKADIHNYFNSVPVERLLPAVREAVGEDERLCTFLCGLLEEPEVLEGGKPIREEKGMMAGTPLSSFYANLYLKELDAHFEEAGVPYARYSDDILVFADTREEAEAHAAFIRQFLSERGLSINPDKETFTAPGEPWVFLGFEVAGDRVDIAPATVKKLKQKMRRKARALTRWAARNGVEPEKAAKAFIRVFNRKLLEGPAAADGAHELTWSRWFFPVITTTDSLHMIDRYAQECLRYILTGTRTKARYRARYEDLKALGYRSLVHKYYAFEKTV